MALNHLQETYKDRTCFSDPIDSEHHTKPQPEIVKLCPHVTFSPVCDFVCVSVLCVYMCVYMCVSVYVCFCIVCVFVYVCVYCVCLYCVYVCVWYFQCLTAFSKWSLPHLSYPYIVLSQGHESIRKEK